LKVIWDYFKDEKCVRGGEPVLLNHKLDQGVCHESYLFCHDTNKVRSLFIWKEYAKQHDTESLVLTWGLALKLVEEFFKFIFF